MVLNVIVDGFLPYGQMILIYVYVYNIYTYIYTCDLRISDQDVPHIRIQYVLM